jgi:UDP:flavonoid glycosyltransferase YjiC (YdhE family)
VRILIPITGSQGDVQPFIALGVRLREAGHCVRLATHADFAPAVRRRGLEFWAIEDGSRVLHETPDGEKMLRAGGNPFTFMRQFARLREPLMHDMLARCWQGCEGADLVVATSTALMLGQAVAEKAGIPLILASIVPVAFSRSLPHCLFPVVPNWLWARGLYNALTHVVGAEYFWQQVRTAVNRARREVLGLAPFPFLGPPPRLFRELPTLYAYSPAVVAKPADWGGNHHVTGFWFLGSDPGWRPPPGLVDFLEAGPAPVCIGFGSMHHRNAGAVTDLATAALARAGRRGVLLTGWGGLAAPRSTQHVYVTDSAPHDWLFPRAAAVVHHGGAGTTGAALQAGVPSVVVPFMADQPFWGSRVHELGVGPEPIPRRKLTAERLGDALGLVLSDTRMAGRAAALAKRIRDEDGPARAVAVIERHAANTHGGCHDQSPVRALAWQTPGRGLLSSPRAALPG